MYYLLEWLSCMHNNGITKYTLQKYHTPTQTIGGHSSIEECTIKLHNLMLLKIIKYTGLDEICRCKSNKFMYCYWYFTALLRY